MASPEGGGASPQGSWIAIGVLGGIGSVFLGWLSVAAIVGLGWLERSDVSLAQVLDLVGRMWLLAHGVRVELGNLTVSLVPLGVTGLIGLALAVATSYAASQMGAVSGGAWRAGVRLIAVVSGSYVAAAFMVGTFVGEPIEGVALLAWTVPLAVGASTLGAVHGLRLRRPGVLPGWWEHSMKGAALTLTVLLIGSAAALVVSLVTFWEQVADAQSALGQQPLGNAVMIIVQLAYLPNAIIWAGSFITGTGFAVGTGTFVAPGGAAVGKLPDMPLLLAIPEMTSSIDWAWLVVPIVGCALGGWWSVRSQELGVGKASLVGAVAGLLASLAWVGLAWVSRGDLGTQRLTGLGPVFPASLLAVPAAVVVSTISALGAGLMSRARLSRESTPAAPLAPDSHQAGSPSSLLGVPGLTGREPEPPLGRESEDDTIQIDDEPTEPVAGTTQSPGEGRIADSEPDG